MRKIAVIGLQSASGVNFTIQRNRRYEFEEELALSLIRGGICAHEKVDIPPAVEVPKATVIINDDPEKVVLPKHKPKPAPEPKKVEKVIKKKK